MKLVAETEAIIEQMSIDEALSRPHHALPGGGRRCVPG